MDMFSYFRKKIIKQLDYLAKENNISITDKNFSITLTKSNDLGEISTNIACVYCNFFNLSANVFALKLINNFNNDKDIKSVNIAKNDFIIFILKERFWHKILINIIIRKNLFSLEHSLKYKHLIYKQTNLNFNTDVKNIEDLSSQNLTFYLPYTYAKICSIINNFKEFFPHIDLIHFAQNPNFTPINEEHNLYLIKTLALWPKILEDLNIYHDSSKIIRYLKNLADNFHDSLKKYRIQYNSRYIINNNDQLIIARCLLAMAVKVIVENAFTILNIKTIEKI